MWQREAGAINYWDMGRVAVDGDTYVVPTIHIIENVWRMGALKVDAGTGDSIWAWRSSRISHTVGVGVDVDGNGDYVVVGDLVDTNNVVNIYVVRLDGETGNPIWEKVISNPTAPYADAQGLGVFVDRDGRYVVVGRLVDDGPSDNYYQGWVLVMDSASGDTIWTAILGGAEYDILIRGMEDAYGNYVLAGYSSSYGSSSNDYDGWMVKLNPDGQVLWNRSYVGPNGVGEWDWFYGLVLLPDGNYMAAGGSRGDSSGVAWVVIVDSSSGDVVGENLWSFSGWDGALDMALDSAGNVVIIGAGYNGLTYDPWFFGVSCDGDSLWFEYMPDSSMDNYGVAISVDGDGYFAYIELQDTMHKLQRLYGIDFRPPSVDTLIGPSFDSEPPYGPYQITALISDDRGNAYEAYLMWQNDTMSAPDTIPMYFTASGTWLGSIPEQDLYGDTVVIRYNVMAMDGSANRDVSDFYTLILTSPVSDREAGKFRIFVRDRRIWFVGNVGMVEVFDVGGRKVYGKTVKGAGSTGFLTPGIYMVRFIGDRAKNRKIIVY